MVGWTLDPTWLVNSGWNGVAVVKQTHINVRACQGSLDCRLRLRLDYGPKCTNKPMQMIKDTRPPKLMSPLAINLKAFPYGLPWTSQISKKKSANGYADSQPPYQTNIFYILSTKVAILRSSRTTAARLIMTPHCISRPCRASDSDLFWVNLYRCPAGLQSMSSMTPNQDW